MLENRHDNHINYVTYIHAKENNKIRYLYTCYKHDNHADIQRHGNDTQIWFTSHTNMVEYRDNRKKISYTYGLSTILDMIVKYNIRLLSCVIIVVFHFMSYCECEM